MFEGIPLTGVVLVGDGCLLITIDVEGSPSLEE